MSERAAELRARAESLRGFKASAQALLSRAERIEAAAERARLQQSARAQAKRKERAYQSAIGFNPFGADERRRAGVEVTAIQAARKLHGDMSDAQVREIARRRAVIMAGHVGSLGLCSRSAFIEALNAELVRLDARPFKVGCGQDLAGIIARVMCADWWTKQLKRAVVQMRERAGREKGEVCARRRQPYVTDDTVRRMLNRDAAARAMLEGTEIESEDGDVITLAQAADAGTANLSIRRGELMTRIRGCEEWADIAEWEGMFTTNTTPSRFHAVLHKTGAINPRWVEAGKPTPKDGQAWLCSTWAKCRAALARRGLGVFGIRVAEPHQDGTPHWHMLIWCKPGMWAAVAAIMAHYWLEDDGDEPGAQEHRFKAKAMHAGGAAGYVAKYISKGIDDAGAVSFDGHVDELPEDRRIVIDQADMFGGGAARVRMWARAHGIRQFQGLGQPPVTVWRELRRVDEGALPAGDGVMRECWEAVNREGERRACWLVYMERQGGPCVGRDYRIRVATEEREHQGRYEVQVKAKPVGVVDLFDPDLTIVPSVRKEWRPRGAWDRGHVRGGDAGGMPGAGGQTQGRGHLPSAPWTRVNNCTGQEAGHERRGPEVGNAHERKAGIGAHRLPDMRDEGGHADHA